MSQSHGKNHTSLEEYKKLAADYTINTVSRITELPVEKIIEMAEMYGRAKKVCTHVSSHSLTHHINGFNTVRNQYALQALRGQIDREGGNFSPGKVFLQNGCGFDTMEQEFACRTEKLMRTRIGAWKYPQPQTMLQALDKLDLQSPEK